MIDPAGLWDLDDAEASAARFRDLAATAEGVDRLVLLQQVARALGLRWRYDEGHAALDDLADNLGMVHADSGDFASAPARFAEALTAAKRIG